MTILQCNLQLPLPWVPTGMPLVRWSSEIRRTCHGLSQSNARGITPNHAPTIEPNAGHRMARSAGLSGLLWSAVCGKQFFLVFDSPPLAHESGQPVTLRDSLVVQPRDAKGVEEGKECKGGYLD